MVGQGLKDSTLVVIPTLNEFENVDELLSRLRNVHSELNLVSRSFDVLFVDDNSSDKTGERISESNLPWIYLVNRGRRYGFAQAYVFGFNWGLQRNYTYICQMDADLSHRPEDLKKLLMADKNLDLVIGSRWVKDGTVINWPFRRIILSRFANYFARSMLNLKVHDITSGFRRWKASTLKSLNFEEFESKGYCFQIELLQKFQGQTLQEVPITFVERQKGKSKMKLNIIIESFFMVLFLKFG
jgi:dolichol-phosphate mannosyltransferase